MKKVVAMVLSLVMALGLMAGCGQKDTGKDSGAKTVESLKIAFSPYADADQITTATEPLEALLKAKLLEKGYDVQNIDMTVGTSYTAVGEALSAGSADIGFISGGNYVLFSDDCDVLLTALRYGINKDSENAADWNDGTLEENTQDMTTYYRSIILAGPSAKGQALLQDISRTEGVAILMNSHNLDQSRAVSSRLLGLHAGRIVLDCAPDAVTDADLARIYGGAESEAAP